MPDTIQYRSIEQPGKHTHASPRGCRGRLGTGPGSQGSPDRYGLGVIVELGQIVGFQVPFSQSSVNSHTYE